MNVTFTPWPDEIAHRYRQEGLWTGENIAEVLERHAVERPEHPAVIDHNGGIGYAELTHSAKVAASSLHAHGIRRGDIVVVQSANDRSYVIVLFALFRLGAIPVCALPAQREAEIGYFCRHTGAAAYLHSDEAVHTRIAQAVTTDVGLTLPLSRITGDSDHSPYDETGAGGAELALLQLSGGSTGVPKLIPRTHDDYLYSVRIAARVCRVDTDTRYLCALPVAHNFPLSSPGVLGVLYGGGTVVMAPDPSPDTCFRLIDTHRVTMTALVPALAKVWLSAAKHRAWKPASLQVLQVGGARIDSADAKKVEDVLGVRLQQVFGMAEGLVCYTRHDDPDDIVHTTQGLPASAWDEIRIVDDNDVDLPSGVDGHLLARGPYTIRGYYRADEHNTVAFTTDGYYRTGDMARITPSGHIVITGRAKDQINRGGEKIAAAEVEERLRTHPAVSDVAVIAVPDPELGERSCAVCVADGLSAKEVRAHLRKQGVAAYKIPDLVRFTDRLPQTAVGKVDKMRLRSEFLQSDMTRLAVREAAIQEDHR